MIYYGDGSRRLDLSAWRHRCRHVGDERPGETPLARHERLVALLIESGQVAQALADRAFEAAGARDLDDPASCAALDIVRALARDVARSWSSDFDAAPGQVPEASPDAWPETVTVREPEGFAFYALYPEAYAVAARRLPPSDAHVIGLRSIGIVLAAMVAAAHAGPSLPAVDTVRPHGHPYRRRIDAPDLMRRLARTRPPRICIVDEGPGRSGSSMAAVVEALVAHGLADSDLHLFPGHPHGPGPEAGPDTRRIFETLPAHVVDFDELVLGRDAPGGGLAGWVSDLTGQATAPLADLSAGRWRTFRYEAPADWPASDIQQERRKYLLTSDSGRYLLKFVGLGRRGAEMAEVARQVSDAGFSPEHFGVRHGFSVERWRDDLHPPKPGERPAWLRFVADYLAFRRCRLIAPGLAGAGAATLRDMTLHNAGVALGPQMRTAVEARLRDFDDVFAQGRRCCIDGRMHAHEWMCNREGIFRKADATDHHAGHDLVGAQDIAWDIAGAAVHLSLDEAEVQALCDAVERGSRSAVSRDLVTCFRPVYLAFELGRLTLAEGGAWEADEKSRLALQRQKMERLLCADLDRVA
ncbi:MAG: hypothetical protein JWL93_1258 [Hyphomicrobiales bacterium]|nr:hypothetical protein [Hyphomicrobiales bacterium]